MRDNEKVQHPSRPPSTGFLTLKVMVSMIANDQKNIRTLNEMIVSFFFYFSLLKCTPRIFVVFVFFLLRLVFFFFL
jgi:hypothetical protein